MATSAVRKLLPRLLAPPGVTGSYRAYSAAASAGSKMVASPMVFISGEEMTRYCMDLIMQKWIHPAVDTSKWEYFDLSCKSRDDTEDQVLRDAVAAGARIKAIFKEPTITPTLEQKEKLGLKKVLTLPPFLALPPTTASPSPPAAPEASPLVLCRTCQALGFLLLNCLHLFSHSQTWGSPNGAMRRGWNGITISRDTIHIEGIKLGFEKVSGNKLPQLFSVLPSPMESPPLCLWSVLLL